MQTAMNSTHRLQQLLQQRLGIQKGDWTLKLSAGALYLSVFSIANMTYASQNPPTRIATDHPTPRTWTWTQGRGQISLHPGALWQLFDCVVLLQMRTTYLIRFHDFAMAAALADGRDEISVFTEKSLARNLIMRIFASISRVTWWFLASTRN